MSNVKNLPTRGVTLDLDSAERPAKDVKEPFVVIIGEKPITFMDPEEIEFTALASVRIPSDIINIALSSEDRKHVYEQSMPGWKMSRLLESYSDYFDFEGKVRRARAQQASFSGGSDS